MQQTNKSILFVLFLFIGGISFSACKTSSKSDPTFVSGEVIVDLKNDFNHESFSAAFKKYDLTVKEVISSSMNIVLFTYDIDKISAERLLKKIKANDSVENAQTNKNINQRR